MSHASRTVIGRLAVGLTLLAAAACSSLMPSATTERMKAFTKRASTLGAACQEAAARFEEAPTRERRREVLAKLKDLNAAMIETAEYEQQARRSNSVELVDANRAFLESGRAWGKCSLQYNRTLVALGEADTARSNYQGVLIRLAGPQFAADRRRIQTALDELDR